MTPDTGGVLIVSEDLLMADAVRATLSARGWRVSGMADDGIRALAHVAREHPERVLLLGPPRRMGIDAFVRQLARLGASPHVVVIDTGNDAPDGSLRPEASLEELLQALAAPPPLTIREAPSRAGLERLATLTPRERTILGLLATGRDRAQIAAELGLSPNTVRTHTQHVYAKLRLHSAADLVRFASRHGLAAGDAPSPA